MKVSTLFGILLIALGVVALVYDGFTYFREEEVARIGPLEVSVEKEERIPLPSVAGGMAVVAGVMVLVLGRHARGKGLSDP
jgi:hypothetical protein